MRGVMCVVVAMLMGCPAESDSDAPIDATLDDGRMADSRVEDASPDAALDAAPDASDAQIISPMVDMRSVDSGPPDLGLDMALDMALDMTPDAAPSDMAAVDPDAAPPRPDMAPDMAAHPDMAPAQPDMAAPDMAAPDMALPDMALPDMALPDMGPDPLARPPVEQCAPDRPEGWACFGDDRACTGELTCIDGLCAPRSDFEGPCDGNADCRAGLQLFCARYSNQGANLERPFCRRRGVAGEACHRRNFGCDFGMVCVNDLCQERSPVGGPCVTSGDCDNTSWCDVTAICTPFIEFGEVCNPQAPGCEPGLVCTNERCAERAPPGDGCQHAGHCAVGQYCDRFDDTGDRRDENVCTPRLQEGDPCDARETSVCSGSICLEGRCAQDQPEEGACRSSFDCEAGFWCPQAR